MDREEKIEQWIKKNGAANFDFDNDNIILFDGGVFSIEKKIRYRPRYRFKKIKEGKQTGYSELVKIKGPKVKYEEYKAIIWIKELDELINYFKRMKRMLNSIGVDTGGIKNGN